MFAEYSESFAASSRIGPILSKTFLVLKCDRRLWQSTRPAGLSVVSVAGHLCIDCSLCSIVLFITFLVINLGFKTSDVIILMYTICLLFLNIFRPDNVLHCLLLHCFLLLSLLHCFPGQTFLQFPRNSLTPVSAWWLDPSQWRTGGGSSTGHFSSNVPPHRHSPLLASHQTWQPSQDWSLTRTPPYMIDSQWQTVSDRQSVTDSQWHTVSDRQSVFCFQRLYYLGWAWKATTEKTRAGSEEPISPV